MIIDPTQKDGVNYEYAARCGHWTVANLLVLLLSKARKKYREDDGLLYDKELLESKIENLMLTAIQSGEINPTNDFDPNSIDVDSIKYLRLKPINVIEWLHKKKILEMITSKGIQIPEQVYKVFETIQKEKGLVPLPEGYSSLDELLSNIASLKKENDDLIKKFSSLANESNEQGKHHLVKRIKILSAALKAVDKNKGKLFHKNGRLKATQLADEIVAHPGLYKIDDEKTDDPILQPDTIKDHITKALKKD